MLTDGHMGLMTQFSPLLCMFEIFYQKVKNKRERDGAVSIPVEQIIPKTKSSKNNNIHLLVSQYLSQEFGTSSASVLTWSLSVGYHQMSA